jgi:hypothetical protein
MGSDKAFLQERTTFWSLTLLLEILGFKSQLETYLLYFGLKKDHLRLGKQANEQETRA